MKVYIVRAEERGAPESWIAGIYSTCRSANERCDEMTSDGLLAWVEEATLDKDCWLANR